MQVGPADADPDGELAGAGGSGQLSKSGADAAVLQHEVGDDSRAVAEGDQGEQGFVTVGLGGDVRMDTQASKPVVGGGADESLTG
jgi:hypothetical protein